MNILYNYEIIYADNKSGFPRSKIITAQNEEHAKEKFEFQYGYKIIECRKGKCYENTNENIISLEMNIENIKKEIQGLYPNMKDYEIVNYIKEALQRKHFQEEVVNFICWSENKK